MLVSSPEDPKTLEILLTISDGPWTISPFTQGNTNSVSLVSTSKSIYILRIFGSKGLIDRSVEYLNIKILSQLGHAPNIIRIFENGMITEYISGDVISDNNMDKEFGGILKLINKWRCIEPEDVLFDNCEHPYLDLGQAISNFISRKPLLIPTLRRWYDMAILKHEKLLSSLEIIQKIEEIAVDTLDCKVSFCHNDLLSSNILKNMAGEICFIDYEYAGFNFQSFEIANHFAEYAGYSLELERIPDSEQIKKLLKNYPNEEIEEIIYFIPISHLFWGVWALLREGNFDYYKYGVERLNLFIKFYKRLNKLK